MKIKKLNVIKSNISDSLSRGKPVLYGKFFKEDLDSGKWTEESVKNNLDRFFGGNWGMVTEKIEEINKKHVQEGKGNLTGIYARNKNRNDDMIIFYSEYNDCIYILSSFDFESFEEAWLSGDEKYVEEFGSGAKYKEPGHQLKREQKEFLRELYPNYEDVKQNIPKDIQNRYRFLLNKDKNEGITEEELIEFYDLQHRIEKIREENEMAITRSESLHYPSSNAGTGALHRSEIEAVKNAIETGKSSRGIDIDIPKNAAETLRGLAAKYKVDYMDVVEKVAEQNIINRKNLKNAYEWVLQNIEKPYFFTDSKPEWLDDEFIDEIVYSKEFPTTIEDIADELVKAGIKEKDSAIKYVKEYLDSNPHEQKHFQVKAKDDIVSAAIPKLIDDVYKTIDEYCKKVMKPEEYEEIAYDGIDSYASVDVVKTADQTRFEIWCGVFGGKSADNIGLTNELKSLFKPYGGRVGIKSSIANNEWVVFIDNKSKEETITERLINKSEDVYKNFEKAAELMTEQSTRGYHYYVGNTYLDYGQDWKWTTIITDDGGYQALTPKEWKDLYKATSDEEIQEIVNRYFTKKYNPDRKGN